MIKLCIEELISIKQRSVTSEKHIQIKQINELKIKFQFSFISKEILRK